jgi:hypothetical protein
MSRDPQTTKTKKELAALRKDLHTPPTKDEVEQMNALITKLTNDAEGIPTDPVTNRLANRVLDDHVTKIRKELKKPDHGPKVQ